MNILLVHFRVGMLDGVSLEMDKWKRVLEENFNHSVVYLTGDLGKSDGYRIPELSIEYVEAREINSLSFGNTLKKTNELALEQKIRFIVEIIKSKLYSLLNFFTVDMMIVNNIFSLPLNIPAAIALAEVIKEKKLKTINHNHDFFWERDEYVPSCNFIQNLLEQYYPPVGSNFHQVVINSRTRDLLKEKNNVDSFYIPNVFDFQNSEWIQDDYNSDIRNDLQIYQNDIVFLQGTRIIKRKGIELIIDLISEMNKSENLKKLMANPLYDDRIFSEKNKIVLVMPNLIEDTNYKMKIEKKCIEQKIEYRFCNEIFEHQRGRTDDNRKIYSLWDAYVIADIITYPSLLEGWGNQFLEAAKAKKPIVVFEYSVYQRDIGPSGFEVISLGSTYTKNEYGLAMVSSNIIKKATDQIIEILQDKNKFSHMANVNHQVGLKKFSLKALGDYLELLMNEFSNQ